MKLKNIFYFSLLVCLIMGGCQLFPPPNVKTIVLEDYIGYWQLSPNGEYLVYGDTTDSKHFFLDLATKQKYEYECRLDWWDSYLMGCYNNEGVSVIDTITLVETSLLPIDSSENVPEYTNLFINNLLEQAKLIYRPEWVTDTVYILAEDYQLNPNKNYVITGLINPDEILKQYVYISIPRNYPKSSASPVNAPNNLYYYEFTSEGFGIFTTDKNELVAEFTDQGASYLEIGGWEVDSSGVYFSTFQGGFGGSGVTKEIRKLKVPDE